VGANGCGELNAQHFLDVNSPERGDGNYRLGVNAYTGKIIAQDHTLAARYFRESAARGNVNGQYALAFQHAVGDGARKSYVQAAKFWELAAEQDHAWAQ
jgi:TPR repeat protein